MSNTTRWLIAIVLIVIGVIPAVFSLAFLGFFTWECYGLSNSIAYNILYIAAVISLISGIVPAIMLIRKTSRKFIVIAIALGLVFTITGNGIFMFYTLKIC